MMRPSELPPSEVCLRGAGGSGPLVLQPEEETGRFETLGEQRRWAEAGRGLWEMAIVICFPSIGYQHGVLLGVLTFLFR